MCLKKYIDNLPIFLNKHRSFVILLITLLIALMFYLFYILDIAIYKDPTMFEKLIESSFGLAGLAIAAIAFLMGKDKIKYVLYLIYPTVLFLFSGFLMYSNLIVYQFVKYNIDVNKSMIVNYSFQLYVILGAIGVVMFFVGIAILINSLIDIFLKLKKEQTLITDWSQFDRGVFLLNVLGIVYNPKTKKILIGRRENDPHIKELSWTFPGGRPAYKEDLEFYLKHEIKIKTGLDTDIKKITFAKTYPEKREFLSIYYLCKAIGGKERAGEKFVELKWVKPVDVQKYFTTSLHPKLLSYLKTLN